MAWPVFMVEEAGFDLVSLRRFRFSTETESTCPRGGIHDASVVVGTCVSAAKDAQGYRKAENPPREFFGDKQWPNVCSCGYAFRPDDEWQVNLEPYYRAADGQHWPMRELPIGAMLNALWMLSRWVGPDGLSLQVKLPPGGPHDWWNIDGPSYNNGVQGPGWTRTGIVPNITVNPSIDYPGHYHGWLQNGALSDPL